LRGAPLVPYDLDVSQSSNTPPSIDVLGIGNALVDVISEEADELVVRLGMVKGSMDLIDETRMAELYDAMGPAVETSGGSAANTMAGLASLGVSAHFIGRVRDDLLGRVFKHDITAIGVGFSGRPVLDGPASGCCLIVVTPDAERTMNTFLGASSLLGVEDLDHDAIASAKVIYLEGYLFDREEAKAAFREASDVAHAAGRAVALSLSDTFCVDRHRDAFTELIRSGVDVLFANESEIEALTGNSDIEAAAAQIAEDVAVVVVTRGPAGAIVYSDGTALTVSAIPVDDLVDTTGAGDQFAAGFLAGWTRDLPLERCAQMGSVAAAEVISHIGPRPHTNLTSLMVTHGLL